MKIFTYKNTLLVSLSLALIAIGIAQYYEHVLHYQPCAMCYEERIPYYILIALIGLALISGKFVNKYLIITVGVIMFFSALYGSYHAGMEWGFWQGPSSCTSIPINTEVDFLTLLNTIKIVPCDYASWRLFGISFAGYNVLVSSLIVGLSGFVVYINNKKSKKSV